jgi:hypothetical protein
MNILRHPLLIAPLLLFSICLIRSPLFAQTSPPPTSSPDAGSSSVSVATSPVAAPTGQPDQAEMMKQMMALMKLNDNHKLLASLDGTWNYNVKMWMDGDTSKKPQESKGTAIRKAMLDGRYVAMDVTGKMMMPNEKGKMQDVVFKGHQMEGYDNVKKKFVSTWMDNMGTGIMMTEGDYDPASKTFTYTGEMTPMPGMTEKVREVIKVTDKDHMVFEYYENRGAQEMKTMQIDYTRKK